MKRGYCQDESIVASVVNTARPTILAVLSHPALSFVYNTMGVLSCDLLVIALAGKVMRSVVSVRRVRLFPFYRLNQLTFDLDILYVYQYWSQL